MLVSILQMGGNLMHQVKCSICKRAIGFYGLGSHVRMHKRQLGQDCYTKNKQKPKKDQVLFNNLEQTTQEKLQ